MPPINVRPTLFVGLGSTGINIITEFRRFMFEQFAMGGLPIIGYIGLETDSAADGADPLFPQAFNTHSFEAINVMHLTVTAVKDLNRLTKNERAEMDRWLDPALLQADGWAINKGAGSVRMNGRLALWLHAVAVATALQNAHNSIMSQAARNQTLAMLNGMPNGAFQGSGISPGYDVYLVGTLCGGTSGGIVVDMAYLVQSLFGIFDVFRPAGMQPADPGIYGVFTIPDHAASIFPGLGRKFANSWASILELDHYMDRETEYDYTLPGMIKRKDPVTTAPLSTIQLVSRENLLGRAFATGGLATWGGEELNRMVALRIFNGMFSGLDNQLAAAFVDGTAAGVMMANVQRNAELRTKTITSFGVSGLWNPLYLFAEAFACKEGERFCDQWASDFDPARSAQLEQSARRAWDAIRNKGLNIMMQVPTGLKVGAEMDRIVAGAKQQLGKQPLSGAINFLSGYPRENPLWQRFDDGGDLRNVMALQLTNAKNSMINDVKSDLDAVTAGLNPTAPDGGSVRNLKEMLRYLQLFEHLVRTDMEACSAAPPQWSFRPPDFPSAQKLSDSFWLKLLGVSRVGIPKAKRLLYDRWKDAAEKHMRETQNHLVRSVYDELLTFHIPGYIMRVENAIRNLQDARRHLEDHFAVVEKALQVNMDCILKVSAFPTLDHHMSYLQALPKLRNDAPGLVAGVRARWIATMNPPSQGWLDLFAEDSGKLAEFIRASYSPWALKQMAAMGTDLPANALARHGQPGDGTLVNLAEWSYPYLTLKAGVNLAPFTRAVDYITGSGNIQGLNAHINGRKPAISYQTLASPLQNLCILFHALPPVYADDLFVSDAMKALYAAKKSSILHTHIKQGNEFDKHYAGRRKKVKDKLWAIQELYPFEAFESAGKDPHGRKLYQITAHRTGGKPVPPIPLNTEGDQLNFCDLAADEGPVGQALRRKFDDRVKQLLLEKGEPEVQQRWAELQKEWSREALGGSISQKVVLDRNNKVNALYTEVFG